MVTPCIVPRNCKSCTYGSLINVGDGMVECLVYVVTAGTLLPRSGMVATKEGFKSSQVEIMVNFQPKNVYILTIKRFIPDRIACPSEKILGA
jgi:hypothetical protein